MSTPLTTTLSDILYRLKCDNDGYYTPSLDLTDSVEQKGNLGKRDFVRSNRQIITIFMCKGKDYYNERIPPGIYMDMYDRCIRSPCKDTLF